MQKRIIIALLLIVAVLGGGYYYWENIYQPKGMLGHDLRLYRNTPVWRLAKAVNREEVEEIRRLVVEKHVPVDFPEPKFGQTLLLWATDRGKAKSVETLLQLGADPNKQDTYNGDNAIMVASYHSFYDMENWCNCTMLKLMLKYGGDPNSVQQSERAKERGEEETPLIKAIAVCLDKVKLLVEAGADINYSTINGAVNPLKEALYKKKIDIVKYLLIDKKADFRKAETSFNIHGVKMTVVYHLRDFDYPLDSPEYKIKMEVVDYMLQQGEDYWKEPIPKDLQKHRSKEYLEKY